LRRRSGGGRGPRPHDCGTRTSRRGTRHRRTSRRRTLRCCRPKSGRWPALENRECPGVQTSQGAGAGAGVGGAAPAAAASLETAADRAMCMSVPSVAATAPTQPFCIIARATRAVATWVRQPPPSPPLATQLRATVWDAPRAGRDHWLPLSAPRASPAASIGWGRRSGFGSAQVVAGRGGRTCPARIQITTR